jgi:tetratricopeptide (TPR) repeat protein
MYAANMEYNSSMVASENVLNGIQDKIETAMNHCFVKNSIAPLDSLSKSLDELSRNNIVLYWAAYIDYYKGVFYVKLGDRDNSKKAIKKAYNTLEKMNNKNSEDYALLALVQSFYIQFTSGMVAGTLSSKIVKNAEIALELDSANLRGWYVLGSNDFYTPESFGGGKKVDYYLKKAISTTPKDIKNPYLPTWGKENAFEMLIRHYIQNKKFEEAKTYLQMAEKEYPDSYFIGEYKKKLATE